MAKRKATRGNRTGTYLTKQALIRATGKATRTISSEAMNIKGYVVKAENGWVVRVYDTGRRQRLSRINRSSSVALD